MRNIVAGDAGEVILAGSDGDTGFVAMFDAQVAFVWSASTTPPAQSIDEPRFLRRSNSGHIAVAGRAMSSTFSNSKVLAVALDATQSPDGYCSAKLNSQGCLPTLVFSGLSSAAATSGFTLSVERALNQANGLFFYGLNGSSATPFQGGTMCLAPPRQRTPLLNSGGSPAPAVDCSGVLALDVNAFASGALGGGANPQLALPGQRVQWQCWSRDASASFGTSLSNALSYVVLP